MNPTEAMAPGPRLTILLVDDDCDCRTLVRDAIQQRPIATEIHEVASGQEALDYLGHRGRFAHTPRPGLIYLDMEMPGESGLEVLKAIRCDADLTDIPVVMLTGVRDELPMRQAACSGANSYIVKPIDPMTFAEVVGRSAEYWARVDSRWAYRQSA